MGTTYNRNPKTLLAAINTTAAFFVVLDFIGLGVYKKRPFPLKLFA